jgi:hypothetical protein
MSLEQSSSTARAIHSFAFIPVPPAAAEHSVPARAESVASPVCAERIASSDASPEPARRGGGAARQASRRTSLETAGPLPRQAETTSHQKSQHQSKNAPANLLFSSASSLLRKRAQVIENTKHKKIHKSFIFCQFRTATSHFSWKSRKFCILRIGYRGWGVPN